MVFALSSVAVAETVLKLSEVHAEGYPTALADGLATACFVTAPDKLARAFDFECAAVHADRTAIMSRHFPGNFFTV